MTYNTNSSARRYRKESQEESTWVSQAYFPRTYIDTRDSLLKSHTAQHAKPSQAMGWMCGSMSVTPAKYVEEHIQHTSLCCPGSSLQTTPHSTLCFHKEKLQQALQKKFSTDHAIVPQELMFSHQTQGSCVFLFFTTAA